MKKLMRSLCFVLILAILVPEAAMAAGVTAGNGVYGVYLEKDAMYQAWYETAVAESGVDYILGVYGSYAYYQTKAVNGVSTIVKQPLYLISDEYAEAGDSIENVTIAAVNEETERVSETVAENVKGRAVLDEAAGYIYYVDAAVPASISIIAEVPTLGRQTLVIYSGESEIKGLKNTVDGLVFLDDAGAHLYISILGRAIDVDKNLFSRDKKTVLYEGNEVVLTDDGTLKLRLTVTGNTTLTINDSVQDFAVYGGYVYYVRRTR